MDKNTVLFTKSMVLLLGATVTWHALLVFGQDDQGWRRTSRGWEHADSVEIPKDSDLSRSTLRFAPLSMNVKMVHSTHRLLLPLAVTGFLSCFGPWLLLRWPTRSALVVGIRRLG